MDRVKQSVSDFTQICQRFEILWRGWIGAFAAWLNRKQCSAILIIVGAFFQLGDCVE